MFLFDWDEGNVKQVIHDYPDRGNTIDEVESLFSDPYFEPLPDRISKYGEQEFSGVAIGTEGIEKHVVYVVRNGKIRPITCRRAKRIMKSLTKASTSNKKTIKVIKNAYSPAEQRVIGDRWADHKGPRMTVAETLTYAAAQQKSEQSAE